MSTRKTRDMNDSFHDWLWSHRPLSHDHGHIDTNLEVLAANEFTPGGLAPPGLWDWKVLSTWLVPHPSTKSRNIIMVGKADVRNGGEEC